MEISTFDPKLFAVDEVERDIIECASNLEEVSRILNKYHDGGLGVEHMNLLINITTEALDLLEHIKEKRQDIKDELALTRRRKCIKKLMTLVSQSEAEALMAYFYPSKVEG